LSEGIPNVEIPLQLKSVSADVEAVKDRFRSLSKERHPDIIKDGGKAYIALQRAAEQAKEYLEEE
jgi:hypothetical protein